MFLTEIFEATEKHAAFCFGRMNPPTIGHGQLIDTVESAAQGGDYFIFVSQSQDSKKNPLDYKTKVQFLKALFPQQASHIIYDPKLKTIMQVAQWLYDAGYRTVTFAAGSDRLPSFKKLLEQYNGVQRADGYYKFILNFVSSGDRDPDADGVEGISASLARNAAEAGNFEAFAQATGAGKLAKPLYDAVRKGMLLEGSSTEFQDKLRSSVPKGKGKNTNFQNIVARSEKKDPHCPSCGLHASDEAKGGKHGKFCTQTNEGWKDAAVGAAMLGAVGGTAMHLHNQPHVEVDGVKWSITNHTPGPLAHPRVATGADGKQYQVWRGPKGTHLAHPIEDKKVDECSGYIPKNKREAKDPRWSNALTVDVHPDTPMKNARALKLA